ncbi:MAG: metal-dependent phosphohydrolase [Candidatus Latescibacterota bacterium]|nr:metal-dependent phosphohydrolase [Candidatus Latescibacterota bacterium]
MLFNFKFLTINRFGQGLEADYKHAYGDMDTSYGGFVNWMGRLALENIANSDGLYHDVEHTMLVTTVGQQILIGKHLVEGGVSSREWAHFIAALLCHDIGYVRGVCKLDGDGVYATGIGDETIELPPGSTDAAMTPYHVDRSKQFVRERFDGEIQLDIDPDLITSYIEMTRFPPPDKPEYKVTNTYAGLLRAADFIGQLGDPDYLRKIPALYYEFEQFGANEPLGYKSPADMRKGYGGFYWNVVSPYIKEAVGYLEVTHDGKQWVSNLHSHVFRVENVERL